MRRRIAALVAALILAIGMVGTAFAVNTGYEGQPGGQSTGGGGQNGYEGQPGHQGGG